MAIWLNGYMALITRLFQACPVGKNERIGVFQTLEGLNNLTI